jgi:aspartokinase/homoserine dehydrogenase 2
MFGNVGEVFIEQLSAQFERLSDDFTIKLVGLIRSETLLFNPSGINIADWKTHFLSESKAYNNQTLLNIISELDYEHKVVVDITASEAFSQLYPEFVALDCHLISANKYAGTADTAWYKALRTSISERNLHWRYNTSVGAGLPVNFALADLQNSGDKITRIEGVFQARYRGYAVSLTEQYHFLIWCLKHKRWGSQSPIRVKIYQDVICSVNCLYLPESLV